MVKKNDKNEFSFDQISRQGYSAAGDYTSNNPAVDLQSGSEHFHTFL